MTKKDVIEYYKAKLSTNEGWVLRGLERIAMRQTEYELENNLPETIEEPDYYIEENKLTEDNNKVGFSGPDAEILTSFYKRIKRGYSLTIKQKEILFQKILKYAGQLVNISLDEGKLIKEGRTYKFSKP